MEIDVKGVIIALDNANKLLEKVLERQENLEKSYNFLALKLSVLESGEPFGDDYPVEYFGLS